MLALWDNSSGAVRKQEITLTHVYVKHVDVGNVNTMKNKKAETLMKRGIPKDVVMKMLGAMRRGGNTPASVMTKYGYGGKTSASKMPKKAAAKPRKKKK